MKKRLRYFTPLEWGLWLGSVLAILGAYQAFDRVGWVTLTASLLGVTALIFNAKGNPIGQGLMVVFSFLYGWISLGCAYYGEMITYLGMSMPMAAVALVSWLRHPYQGNRAQVQVNHLRRREILWMLVLAAAVTAGFYFILRAFHTANLPLSTLSVTTSFLAVYLTFRRSPWYAVAYAANDLVLIGLWLLVADYAVAVCFAAFFLNDGYGFIRWRQMARCQAESGR